MSVPLKRTPELRRFSARLRDNADDPDEFNRNRIALGDFNIDRRDDRNKHALPQDYLGHVRPLLRRQTFRLRSGLLSDAPGRTRTCDPLLRRREHLLRSTAACRSVCAASDGLRIAAALCCGLPLPSRFQMRLQR
jgi:hypothetical protein